MVQYIGARHMHTQYRHRQRKIQRKRQRLAIVRLFIIIHYAIYERQTNKIKTSALVQTTPHKNRTYIHNNMYGKPVQAFWHSSL